MPTPVIRVLIVDDQGLFRAGLRSLLEAEPGFSVIGEAESGIGAAALAQRLQPDVMLLDLALPGMSGMDVLRELAASHTRIRTVVLTASVSDAGIIEAVQTGAVGILLKTVATELLYKCLRSVMAGQYWLGRDAMASMVTVLAARQSQTLRDVLRPDGWGAGSRTPDSGGRQS
jgi:DNA-binding NarL/FixJ family response regulator